MEEKYIMGLTAEEKKIIESALRGSMKRLERKAEENKRKGGKEYIFSIVADRQERAAQKMLRVFLKFVDMK